MNIDQVRSPQRIEQGRAIVKNWIQQQRVIKKTDPKHRVVLDYGMESVRGTSPEEIARKLGANDSLRSVRGIDLKAVWDEIQEQKRNPTGGAGGLGIIGETLGWVGPRYGDQLHVGVVNLSLLHTMRRTQGFSGTRQTVAFNEVVPGEGYYFLGEAATTSLHHQARPTDVYLYTGFSQENRMTLAFRLSLPGVTGIMYPPNYSQANFDQMQVLGNGGFNLMQSLGLLGAEDPLIDLVIGHDGHTALLKFNLFLWFLEKYGNKEVALAATRKLCLATDHAPQLSTHPLTTGEMVSQHYGRDKEALYGEFGMNHGERTDGFFADVSLSGVTGAVSPIQVAVTAAEEIAVIRGFGEGAKKLLPNGKQASSLVQFPDTIDIESWLGAAAGVVLDSFIPAWRRNPSILKDQLEVDALCQNFAFRDAIAEAFEIQDQQLQGLVGGHFPRFFEQTIPEDAIILASLRRVTRYKTDLLASFFSQGEQIEAIAEAIGHPIFWLFGGIAHQDDSPAIDNLTHLLDLIGNQNKRRSSFTANFLIGYEYDLARWIFPGLAMRGCWIGATNPIMDRSQGTEAFGPSYLKALLNGGRVIGTYDGGAGCLRALPTVFNYGPVTMAGGKSLHNDWWGNGTLRGLSPFLLSSGFLGQVEKAAAHAANDLERFAVGRGAFSPGLEPKIRAMCHIIANYNGSVLMQRYLDEAARLQA